MRRQRLAIWAACWIAFAGLGLAQVDSAQLRAKLGAPLNRETFRVKPGFDVIADYGPKHQVCRLELPPGQNIFGDVPASVVTKKEVDELLAGLVPASARGKELRRTTTTTGRNGISVVEYENLSITEPMDMALPGRIAVIVIFKSEGCQATAQH